MTFLDEIKARLKRAKEPCLADSQPMCICPYQEPARNSFKDIERLVAACEIMMDSLIVIERAYPLDGDRMSHQDYAKIKLELADKILGGGE